ncbi:proline dehydrogenase family protein [Salinibacterium hongtaonis]|uniref:L-glutamate gamma-semialdehyde dehydrogenase n=1 Tax=Homoserinimonas hongtaonis TaxID=2079791 RepID=A0A2U1SYL2_9MICO|nr:proline dehydrogenase family protein [Salinibacterium hongtaonis]PWB96717.1 1-pyrroline-5-carboxylate dehydrogenase [Salinibacterium hongtaonis]
MRGRFHTGRNERTEPPVVSSADIDAQLARDVTSLVRRWLAVASEVPVDASARQLAGVLKDPHGLEFTVGFVDGVIRPEDRGVAARNLRDLAPKVPSFLPWHMRSAVRLGGRIAPLAPGIVIPIARRVLRRMVGHLIIDATDSRLGAAISAVRGPGIRLNLNLLGEAVLGDREADRRLAGTRALLARDDVDYVSIKVSSTVAPLSPWAFDAAVEHVVEKLTPLFRLAAAAPTPKFINLDMEEYKDLDLTIAVFQRILDEPDLLGLEAGIVLQAYLPDALGAMMRLQEWAAARRSRGGAGIKVRVVKGANLAMERVEASLHGWPLATWDTKRESDTNYKRVISYALHPDRVENVRIGVAGHNLFDLAFAWLLANRRGTEHGVDFEMLLGMAQGQAEAVRRDVGGLLLYTPVVHPAEFDVAIAYLIRRLEEGASQENFMSAVFELSASPDLFAREETRFIASLGDLDGSVPPPRRTQDRRSATALASTNGFHNSPDTDPALPANREWARDILQRVPTSTLGEATVAANTVGSEAEVDNVIGAALAAGSSWGAMSGSQRAEVLHRAGSALEKRRADLIEVMAAETGKTLDQSDPEVSEAVDFAHYYAELARELDAVDGAVFEPSRLTVVTPPWNFPVAIPAGSTLGALAAGSSVIIKPAQQARRCGAVMVEALWEAGVPRDALRLVNMANPALGETLIADHRIDRVNLTGAFETAEKFRAFRHDLPLLAETSGKNAIIVTPSADLDLAVRDVVSSAFGHAGQKCSAASLVILVGSVSRSRRFHDQLLDAVRSLPVGYPTDPTVRMGPIIAPAEGKLLRGLTTLAPRERWVVTPRRRDDSGRLWTPGVRAGVQRGSDFHLTEFFGPVLGIMTAHTLQEAIDMQNEVDYGLTAGLHSLDRQELSLWLDQVQAGNLYVNRGTTGAIVRRQPFGGWKKSAIGAGAKAGGPNYLIGLGRWRSAPSAATSEVSPRARPVADAVAASLGAESGESVLRSFRSDTEAWREEFGQPRDVSGLAVERNIFRYLPTPVAVRLAEAGSVTHLVRVIGAGLVSGSSFSVSTGVSLPDPVAAVCAQVGVPVTTETDARWCSGLARFDGERIRLIGAPASMVTAATDGRPEIAVYAESVTESGRIEILPFVREQAVSITAHRFGTPSTFSDGII